MRFLDHEHAAITAALRAHGVDPVTVLFVKRRGRLHVELPGRAGDFVFFRKKSATLDANGQWRDRTEYFIGEANAKGTACSWEDVLQAFTRWLKDIA